MDFNALLEGIKAADTESLLYVIKGGDFDDDLLYKAADDTRREHYGIDVYIRGLIEFTNYCGNDCLYCGIRRSNHSAERYRLCEEEILSCCKTGFELGFRTFVLQGGEDGYFTDDKLCSIVSNIKAKYPDCAVTLSAGERSYASYKRLFDAGADRYLLRHETANAEHYSRLHPKELTLAARKDCLYALKDIGFQVGAGFMVGSPFQTAENLVEDFLFLKELCPHMVGIGPFIPHKDTPFAGLPAGGLRDTLACLAMTRIMLPCSLIPATTALGTIAPEGRILGLKAGANVVMPNLSPREFRHQYALYDNKISTGKEAVEGKAALERQVLAAGYKIVTARGDFHK